MPVRWRLTMFIALVIGAILLLQGIALFFLLREALLSNVEDTARDRASSAARGWGKMASAHPLDLRFRAVRSAGVRVGWRA